MDEEPAIADPSRYRAFVSYSHADAKFAHWLHRRLESWRLPDKTRLAPVFIDRAELAAGDDLSAKVREALAESAALVVVASPNARASRWVGQEIALFRQLHPDRPILTALIAGEPGEAFPETLVRVGERELEPLAADFRKGHDGRRLGLLKIVAGLTGLPLDRLVQRDNQARQRRVMAVTAGALLLSLILAAALVFTLRARAEAERQRAEAEGLVEFMLTDLRDKLRGTGDPKIMAAVNQRALDYYSHMDVSQLSDDSLERRARVLHAMGEDNERLGNFPAAQKMYHEAWRITDEVLRRHPENSDAIFAHAQSEFWVGEAAWQQRNLATTERHWRAYLRQAEALARAEPQSKRSMMELGYAKGNLCELVSRTNLVNAVKHCDEALQFLQRAVELDPNDLTASLALANRIGWQADVYLKLGRYDQAIANRRQEQALITRLATSNPKNLDLQERMLWPQIGLGEALFRSGQEVEAITVLAKVLKQYDFLSATRSRDALIAERRARTAWLIALSARQARLPSEPQHRTRALDLLANLKKTHTAEQLRRFTFMIDSLEKETGE